MRHSLPRTLGLTAVFNAATACAPAPGVPARQAGLGRCEWPLCAQRRRSIHVRPLLPSVSRNTAASSCNAAGCKAGGERQSRQLRRESAKGASSFLVKPALRCLIDHPFGDAGTPAGGPTTSHRTVAGAPKPGAELARIVADLIRDSLPFGARVGLAATSGCQGGW